MSETKLEDVLMARVAILTEDAKYAPFGEVVNMLVDSMEGDETAVGFTFPELEAHDCYFVLNLATGSTVANA
jgi:hypothetical protein